LGPEHIRQYQLYLVHDKHASWSLVSQTVCALRFFYHITLGQSTMIDFRGFQSSSDRRSSWFPLTQNLANRPMVRSTISFDVETMIDLRLKRPNQCVADSDSVRSQGSWLGVAPAGPGG